MAEQQAGATVTFKFKDEVADKELTHSMNEKQWVLDGDGEFECTPLEWECIFGRLGLFDLVTD